MAKPPAFQLYVKDAYTGCAEMSGEEFGAYMRGLCWSWDNGPLPLDPARRARVMMVERADFDRVWEVVGPNWQETPQGFTNARLEVQRAELEAYRLSCAENGAKGGRPKKAKPNPSVNPEETERLTKQEPKTNPEPNPEESTPVSDLYSALSDLPSAHAEPARADLDGGTWRQRGRTPGLLSNPIDHAQCYPSAGCGRGLCVPRFVSKEWLGQFSGDAKAVDEFIANTLRFTPAGPQGDPVKWWRAKWDEKYRAPVVSTKSSRTIAAGLSLDAKLAAGAEIDPFGTIADRRALAAKESA